MTDPRSYSVRRLEMQLNLIDLELISLSQMQTRIDELRRDYSDIMDETMEDRIAQHQVELNRQRTEFRILKEATIRDLTLYTHRQRGNHDES